MMSVTPDRGGTYYLFWLMGRPTLRLLFRLFPGPLGLRPPAERYRPIRRIGRRIRMLLSAVGLTQKPVIYPELEKWDWWQLYIWQSIRRTAGHSQGGTATIAIGLIAIAISIMIGVGEIYRENTRALLIALAITMIATVFLLTVLICWAAYAALRTATPDLYANIVLRGKGESQCLRVLAYEMTEGCVGFIDNSKHLLSLQAEISNVINEPEEVRSKLARWEAQYHQFSKDLLNHAEHLQRLKQLKAVAAEQLDINPERLCQSILSYSPITHAELVIEYNRVCVRMHSECKKAIDGSMQTRHLKKANQYSKRCLDIIQTCRDWAAALKDLFDYDYLHIFVHRIGSKHSTSGAVEEYALALREIATRQLARLKRLKDAPEDERQAALELGISELKYIFARQKAYPGLDVHTTLRNLCDSSRYESDAIYIGISARDLDVLARILDWIAREDDLRQYFSVDKPGIPDRYKALRQLPDIVSLCLSWSRDLLSDLVTSVFDCWADDPTKLVILTHGYSKTVRDVLKEAIPPLGDQQPAIFVTDTSNGGAQEASGDARRMAYALEQKIKRKFGADAYTGKIISGDARILSDLRPSGRLLVILGAECFSSDGKAIHPRGALEMIDGLKWRRADCLTVVLAENYKLQDIDSLISGSDLLHMQRLDIYAQRHIDMIITDNGIINTNRRTKKIDRLIRCVENRFEPLLQARRLSADAE